MDLSAASSASGFTSVSNKMREKTLLERVTATENYFIMQKQKVLKKKAQTLLDHLLTIFARRH